MKNNLIFRILTLVFFFGLITLETFAQGTGKIVGKVTDEKTGETLIGLNVKVVGMTKGASTNVEGRYVINGLEAGKYTLEFSYMGFQTKKISDVDVKAGVAQTVNVVMKEASSQKLKEVVITASARKESVNALYAAQKNSARVSDGVSAESIAKSPDKNTSEVLKRVSGTTIQDNKFVIVRGLSDRYNNAQLDNSPLPSSEPNRKAFSFDIIPSNMIDNIIISKTATPDLPGDFTGGNVQILTKSVPDQDFTSFSVGYGYNSQTTFKSFQGGFRNFSDFLGFDNGSRQLPSNFPSSTQLSNLSSAENVKAINSLNQNWRTRSYNATPGQNYVFSLGRVRSLENNNRFGSLISVSYRNSYQVNPNGVRDFHDYQYNDNLYKFSSTLGGVANFTYSYGKSRLSLKNIYNRTFDDRYLERSGLNLGRTALVKFYAFDVLQKSLLKSTLEGEHAVGSESKSKIKWNAGFSQVTNNQPDQKKVSYSENYSGSELDNAYTANVTSLGKENARLFSDLKENIASGDISYTTPLKFLGEGSTLKSGLSSQYRSRNFDVRFIGLVLNTSYSDANEVRTRSLDQLFGADLISQNAYRLDEIPNAADRYNATAFTNAAYLMLDNKISSKLRVVWGLRAEKFDLDLQTKSSGIAPIKLNNFDLLPSANFTYGISDKSNLRWSYSRTLARPEFRELAPFAYYDYELLGTVTGNKDLKRSLIDNVDLRYELFPSAGQVFSISGFYKKFTNAIESRVDDRTFDFKYFNSESAYIYGGELEFRRDFSFIGESESLKNLTFYTNLSLIKSLVKNPKEESTLIEKERPLSGQSPYVINGGLQYLTLSNKLSMNMLYNRIGRRINRAGGTFFRSIYENPRNILDFQASYKVKKRGELKLNVSDILNNYFIEYLDNDLNGKYNSSTGVRTNDSDRTFNKYKPGTNISLSFGYTF